LDLSTLYELMLAANYLEVKGLINLVPIPLNFINIVTDVLGDEAILCP
jgi:hypothetical protein